MIAPRDPRRARLEVIKHAIATNTYETPEKLAAALDAFLLTETNAAIAENNVAESTKPSTRLQKKKPK
jgi:hypothetical protein